MIKVWLDLEDTIITNWDDGILLNPNKIKNWLDKNHIEDIDIWSFAIWNQQDKDFFVSSNMKTTIENALKRRINDFLSVEDMQSLIFDYERITYFSREEFMQLNSKKWSFIKYCLGYQMGHTCYLIDDAVPNQTIIDHNTNTTIHLVNIISI